MHVVTIARQLPKYPLSHVKNAQMILNFTRRSYKYLVVQISREEIITWHEMCQSLQTHHCIVWQYTLLSNLQNLHKVENYIVIFNGNVLGHA